MVQAGEDAAKKLVQWLNWNEAYYLREFEKSMTAGPSYDRITVLGEKGLELFATWREAGQAQWRAVETAQHAIGDVIRAIRAKRDDDARRLMQQNFRNVPMTWDVLKDRSRHTIVTPVVESQTPLGYGICLLGWVTQLHLAGRIRECERESCRKWFFAKPAKKKFCSPECQEEFWAERRRGSKEASERMKRWHQAHKSRRGRKAGGLR